MNYLLSFKLYENTLNLGDVLVLPTTNMKNNYTKTIKSIDLVLKAMGLNSGRELLKEIPMVETRIGTIPGTIRTSGNGGRGLWQIDKIAFDEVRNTSRHPQLIKYINNIKQNLGIDIKKLVWNDCNKIIIGCIFARLLMVIKSLEPDDKSRVIRAQQWKKHYNTSAGKGTVEKYWQVVQECIKSLGLPDPYQGKNYEEAQIVAPITTTSKPTNTNPEDLYKRLKINYNE